MDQIREHIYLAALLHDIGKFYQRADIGSVKNSKYLKDYCKDEASFCPLYKGRYSHKHVLWTAQFIDDFNAVFANLVSHGNLNLSEKDNLLNLAAGHHLSMDQLSQYGKLIKEADCLSSGMDRDSELALRDDDDENSDWDAFKRKRLIPITDTISRTSDALERLGKWRINIGPLSLTKDAFPTDSTCGGTDYEQLWKAFIGEFKFIQANTYKAFSETLLSVLYKYTSCIPSSTVNFPDVSLYDHLKTTAALAVCLYDAYNSGEDAENPFLLIGGDISGIQPYIYNIVSKYAGKNLKGRSFYIRLLTDSVCHYLLEALDLYSSNVIYNSGGGFYILAPNTQATKNKVDTAISVIEESMFKEHGTNLYLAIDRVEVSKDMLLHRTDQGLGMTWNQLFDKKEAKKNAKYQGLLAKDPGKFFTPMMTGGEESTDIITGENFAEGEKHLKVGELKPLRPITGTQIELGSVLRDFDCMVVSDEIIPYWTDCTHIEPLGLGIHYYFVKKSDLEEKKKELRASADKVVVVTLNGDDRDCQFLGLVDGIDNAYRLEFYGGNGVGKGYRCTFEDMCKNLSENVSEDALERLGILRMDVDNLGSIFQRGIAPERSTLSRMAALSRSFDYFFSGYLNTIWTETDPERSFILYSGGDDLFIVGSWNVTISLAERIRTDFKEFTCYNPAFSISGGISIVGAKFPIAKGAEMSATEEKRAKNHKMPAGNMVFEKNSISFLGISLNFDNEYPQAKALKNEIVRLYSNSLLAKSFISKVLRHWENAQIKDHKITNMKTYWMAAYDLCRLEQRESDAKKLIKNCKKEICSGSAFLNGQAINTYYHPLELWAFACRWAELELRTQK